MKPKEEQNVTLSISMPRLVADRLNVYCRARLSLRSRVVAQAIDEYLSRRGTHPTCGAVCMEEKA